MATTELSWKVDAALRDLDRKQNYLQHAKDYVKDKCREAAVVGALILGITGMFSIPIAGLAGISYILGPDKKAETYETNRNKNSTLEEKYSGLAKKVSAKTGVDERILLGLIAGGNTSYAKDLREKGYSGIIPLLPEEAGVTAETLNSDNEQCLMSAANVFKKIAEKQNDLEGVVGFFWHREKEAEAEKFRDGCQYMGSAQMAYAKRTDDTWQSQRIKALQDHEGALSLEKYLSTFSEEERTWREAHASQTLIRKIKNPAYLFCCKASIDAFERNRAGDEFTWIDLLPPKLASAIYCSLAYMNGVEFKPKNGSGE